ncbi:MAG: ATP-dependent sacrificial sulfur transferase LarE [Bacteroidia bacterium]|nr:ATP-dependent sacrificial sulfur transferase LarE [Bacteroidia bacterium]
MIHAQIQILEKWFEGKAGTLTAFSGGIDSTLVLFLSGKFLGDRAIGCMSVSPSLKRKDYAFAQEFCRRFGLRLEIIETAEVHDPNYLANPANRCYFCKSHLYHDLTRMLQKYPGYALLNGTNTDDFGDYRPGLQAAAEHQVLSPLADCGLSKADVRNLARHFGLPNWNKPASPCLSSRVPYGNTITEEKLRQIETAEGILNAWGFEDVRVRHLGTEAKIEVPTAELPRLLAHAEAIQAAICQLGFETCSIDTEGLVSGKLNRMIFHK